MLLAGALEKRYRILLSVPLMLEYESVLTLEEHLQASALHRDDIAVILDAIAAVGEPIRLAYLWRPILADSRHDMALETTVNGRANVLVTVNSRHFQPLAASFAIDVVSPAAIRNLDRFALLDTSQQLAGPLSELPDADGGHVRLIAQSIAVCRRVGDFEPLVGEQPFYRMQAILDGPRPGPRSRDVRPRHKRQ